MSKQSHDHNFKNLFLDFPNETLDWLFPQAEENWGQVRKIKDRKHNKLNKNCEGFWLIRKTYQRFNTVRIRPLIQRSRWAKRQVISFK